MKVNDVPQDKRDFKEGDKLRKLIYAVGEDGQYAGVNSAGWEAENFAMKQAWDDISEQLAKTEAKVRSGALSPVAYFMQKNLMDIALLARYSGKWRWQIKRHFKPDVFRKLKPETLAVYARIFNVTTDELINFGINR